MSDEEKEETSGLQPEKMKVNELKTLLNERGLDTKGVKAVLVSRLRQALTEEECADDEDIGEEIKIDIVESVQEPITDERIIDTGQEPLVIESMDNEGSGKVIEDSNVGDSDHKSELMALIDRAADDKPDEMEDVSSDDPKNPSGSEEDRSHEAELKMPSSVNTTDEIGALDKNLEELAEKTDEEDKMCNIVVNDENAEMGGIEDKNLEKGDVQDVSSEFDRKVSKEEEKEEEEEEKEEEMDATTSKECTQLTDVASGENKEEVKTDIMDDIIKTMDTLTETLDKSKDEDKVKPEEAERDLSSVEPNRDADEIVIADEVIIKNPDDVQSVEKLSRELSKLKVVVLELTNYFPDFQPRSKEKLLLNLPFKDNKNLDEKQMDEFKTALNQLSFNSNLSNSGVVNLAELLASVSAARLVKDKLSKLIRNVAELSDQLVDYAGHLKRKRARREEERSKSKSKSKEVEGETIGKAKVAIFRRKGDFPIIGVSERDISPIRENFDIKKVGTNIFEVLI